MTGPRPVVRDRSGFTLIELLVVVLIVGILGGMAFPSLRAALHRADAGRIVNDVRTISQAALSHLATTGSFPSAAGQGAVPAELAPRLPETLEFEYKDVRYMWSSLTLPNSNNAWGTDQLGLVWVFYDPGSPISRALQAHTGSQAIWTATLMLFLVPG